LAWDSQLASIARFDRDILFARDSIFEAIDDKTELQKSEFEEELNRPEMKVLCE